MWGKRGVLFAFRFFGMTCRSLRGGEVFVHVFFVFRLLCILAVCFVALRPLIYLCSFIKKKTWYRSLGFRELMNLNLIACLIPPFIEPICKPKKLILETGPLHNNLNYRVTW